jgi:hypothetical protein
MNKPKLLSPQDLESWRAICRDGLLGSQGKLTLAAGLVHALSHIEVLEADAARYRWLRGRPHSDIAACWYLPDNEPPPVGEAALDEAIDRAMKATS